jgi:hypothetical protein
MPDYSERITGTGEKEKKQENGKKKGSVRLSSMMKYLLLVFCIFFCLAVTFSKNSELLMSGTLKNMFSEKTTILVFGLIVWISRLLKLVVNFFLPKILEALREKVILIGSVTLFAASMLTGISGIYLKNTVPGIIMMAVVYILMCMIWDPMRTYLRMAAVDTNSRRKQQNMLVLLNLGQSVINVFMKLTVYVILKIFSLEYVFPFFALISILEIILALRLSVKCRESIEILDTEKILTAEALDDIAVTVYDLLTEYGLERKQALSYRFLIEEKLLDKLEHGHEKEKVRIVLFDKHGEISVKLSVGGEEIDVFAIPQTTDESSSKMFGNLLGGLD